MKIIFFTLSFMLIISASLFAQDGTFTASVDRNNIGMGEQLQLTVTLNGSTGMKNFRAPSFNDFVLLSGPNQSTNMQFINGSMSSSISYTYILQPRAVGKATIGAATVELNGKQLQTRPIVIEVSKGAPQQKQQGNQTEDADIGKQIGDNLFLKATVDKAKVYQGEQITVTYKLYNRTRLSNINISKLPSRTGFWSEDLEQIKQVQFTNEVVNGKQYNVAVLKKAALFPQRSGTLMLDPMEVDCQVQIQMRKRSSNDIFDQFFNDPFFGNVQNVKHTIQSSALSITVMPLPSDGSVKGFGGAVGKFTMDAWLDKRQTKTNDPVTLKIKISGRGNLKLLDAPELNIPPDLEKYDPKVSDNLAPQGNFIAGTRTFEYLLIPRHAGEQKIPSFPFSFFDIEKKNYVTLNSPEFVLSVDKGSDAASSTVVGMTKEDVKLLGEDIRFIKSGAESFSRTGETFFGSPVFYVFSLSPVLACAGIFLYARQRRKTMGDVAGLRDRKARKVAKQRLMQAKKFLHQQKKEEFYSEVSRALWGYVADKLGIPPAELSKEAARVSLEQRGVTNEHITGLVGMIEQCDFARFAPSAQTSQMDTVYGEAEKLISAIEDNIR